MTDPPSPPGIRRIRPRDHRGSIQVLARAFRDSPLNRAVIRESDRSRRLRSNLFGTRTLLPVAAAHRAVWVAHRNDDIVGALIGTAPNCYPLPPPSLPARLVCTIGQGWSVARRWGDVFSRLDEIHLIEPHWYLGTLGIDPDHQGRGVGTAMLRHWLEFATGDPAPIYLETDRVANVSFYQRQGFDVVRETEVLGTKIWCMRRAAGSG
ncbi:MAG: GNAT family N-acetyltransferase [Deltaproteobacteria bacterium]|nr:MAG: GNAT family N-acetyltransferase [Deltaproteobacteria bacterium]TDJ17393.1 MAG: GNAT family N-acetyltransferase [Deltaproteobacteria bacterium]